jgi:hypothetical protein
MALVTSASARRAAAPTEHFRVLNTSVSGAATVVAWGPLHARGKDVVVNNRRDRFVFPKGALIVRHRATSHRDTFDKVTCYGQHTESGIYRVLSGTRAYAGASGLGTYTVVAQFVGCSQTKPPRVFMFEINASGPLRL